MENHDARPTVQVLSFLPFKQFGYSIESYWRECCTETKLTNSKSPDSRKAELFDTPEPPVLCIRVSHRSRFRSRPFMGSLHRELWKLGIALVHVSLAQHGAHSNFSFTRTIMMMAWHSNSGTKIIHAQVLDIYVKAAKKFAYLIGKLKLK